MASLTDGTSLARKAVAKMARKLQRLCPVVLRRCCVADEERAEQEMNLGTMQSTGVRNRRAPEQTPESNDDHPASPTTSGTLTPGTSEVPSENEGMNAVQVVSAYKSANLGNTYLQIPSSGELGNVFLIGSELAFPGE
jgi:hypothetical protein